MKNSYKNLVGNPQRKRTYEKPRRRWEGNVTIALCLHGVELSVRDNFRFAFNLPRNFLTNILYINFLFLPYFPRVSFILIYKSTNFLIVEPGSSTYMLLKPATGQRIRARFIISNLLNLFP